MAKSSKKNTPNIDKLIKKVNKEFKKTSDQVEDLLEDAFRQFDQLQRQVQEPLRKLTRELDELREREIKRLHDEFDRRMEAFDELQNTLAERLESAQKDASQDKKAARTAKKSSRKEKKAPATPGDLSDLTRIRGIGPVTARKMRAAGILSINQIANPTDADKEELAQFSAMRGYSDWQEEARKLIS